MMFLHVLFSKFKEVLCSVLPITIIVFLLNFTISPIEAPVFFRFIIGVVFIIAGLTIFLFGVDIGIGPIGNSMGSDITRKNKIWFVVVAGLVLGFFISIAEPDLQILADQIEFVTSGIITKWSIVIIVSVGISVFLSAGLIRIVYNTPLYKLLSVIYLVIFVLALFTSQEFLAISFDASGATTGALTVPFILALAKGVSELKKDSKASEKDSFGLVAIASSGAIISVMLMSIFSKADKIASGIGAQESATASIISPFLHELPVMAQEIVLALLPILAIFLASQKVSFNLSRKAIRSCLFGLLYTFIGLVLFLTGVNAGFMDVGRIIGHTIASMDNKTYIIVIGFIIGFVTILAEPAVNVLTHQIEDVTSGYVRRNVVLIALSIGVGFAVALSMVRILVPEIKLWHYLLPGYLISLAMMYLVPKLFIGIAFDSGGVASGPMTATFILAFAQGAADQVEKASVLADGFGIIATVALMPIIALQILGLIFKIKSRTKGVVKNV